MEINLNNFRQLKDLRFPSLFVNPFGEVYNIITNQMLIGDTESYRLYPSITPLFKSKLVAEGWKNEPEYLWKDSPYAENIRNARDFQFVGINHRAIIPTSSYGDNHLWITSSGEVYDTSTWERIPCLPGRQHFNHPDLQYIPADKIVAMYFVEVPMEFRKRGLNEATLNVFHRDGNPDNIAAYNLRWVEPNSSDTEDNSKSHVRTRVAIGDDALEKVAELLHRGYSNQHISSVTGMSIANIGNIRNRRSARYASIKLTWPMENPTDTSIGVTEIDKQKVIAIYKDNPRTMLYEYKDSFPNLTQQQILATLMDFTDYSDVILKSKDRGLAIKDLYFGGMLIDEIALWLNISPVSVQNTLNAMSINTKK